MEIEWKVDVEVSSYLLYSVMEFQSHFILLLMISCWVVGVDTEAGSSLAVFI